MELPSSKVSRKEFFSENIQVIIFCAHHVESAPYFQKEGDLGYWNAVHNLMNRVYTVSYTHLDVYKRQS